MSSKSYGAILIGNGTKSGTIYKLKLGGAILIGKGYKESGNIYALASKFEGTTLIGSM